MKKHKPLAQKSKKGGKRRKRDANLVPHAVISGYYGFDNLGDELILKVLTDELKDKGVKVTVLSQNPAKTEKEYGVHAIKRTSFIDIVDVFAQANLFISGGGGLFQDATGPMSTIYYGGLIHLANFFEVPTVFWAQGVGPLNKGLSRKMTASALHHCEAVLVRDQGSANLVEEISGLQPEITADPVWLLRLPKNQQTLSSKKIKSATWKVGISLRTWKDLTEARLQTLATALNDFASTSEHRVEVLLLPFQKTEDTHLLQDFAKSLDNTRLTYKMIEPSDVLHQLEVCDAIIGMRFHSLILGLLANIPVYGLIYDPKVASLIKMFNLQGTPIHELDGINGEALQQAFSNYPAIDLKPFKKESRRNLEVLHQLLNLSEAELVR